MFGCNSHVSWSEVTATQRDTELDRIAALGADWVRIDIGWGNWETAKGTHDTAYGDRVDGIVTAATSRGLSVLLILYNTPSWAGSSTAAPPDPQDYADYCGFVAARYQGVVGAYEIWNEPDLPGFFDGTQAQYVACMQAAYPAIKTADPDALVVMGGPSTVDDAWFSQGYALGWKGAFDVACCHPYPSPANMAPGTPDPGGQYAQYYVAHVPVLRQVMLDNSDDSPLWFTEFGWSNHANDGSEQPWELGVTDAQQGQYLTGTLDLIAGQWPYVECAFWYTAQDRSDSGAHQDNFGLLATDMEPKQSYDAAQIYLAGEEPPPDSGDGMADVNLCNNPAVANNTNDWYIGTGSWSRITTGVVAFFERGTAMECTTGSNGFDLYPPSFDVVAGQTYTMSMNIWTDKDATFEIDSEYKNSSGDAGYPDALPITTNGGVIQRWTLVTTCPSGRVSLRPDVYGPNAGSGITIQVSDVRYAPGAGTSLAYYDGDSDGWEWDGTPGSSSSTQSVVTTPASVTAGPVTVSASAPAGTVHGGVIAPVVVAGPATTTTVSTPSGDISAAATVPGQRVHAIITAPSGTVAAGSSIPAQVTARPVPVAVDTPNGTLTAPAVVTGPVTTVVMATLLAPVGDIDAATIIPAGVTGPSVIITLTAPAGGVHGGSLIVRDITLIPGPITSGWSSAAPVSGWGTSAPTSDQYAATDPVSGWTAGAITT